MDKFNLIKSFVASRENGVPIIAAFGYGSGVFKQNSNPSKENMIDTIFVVEKPKEWHRQNIAKNPKDYWLGSRIYMKYIDLNSIQSLTGITYQTYIPFEGSMFKYGIISFDNFKRNFLTWDHFIFPGRFQKQVMPIKSTQDIEDLIQINRKTALFIALLLLSDRKFTLKELFFKISNLSFIGDLREKVAEIPNKSKDLVDSGFENFIEIYGTKNEYFYVGDDGYCVLNKHLLYSHINLYFSKLIPFSTITYNGDEDIQKIIQLIIEKLTIINKRESKRLALTGVLTIGPINSVKYVYQKRVKMFKSKLL